MRRTCFSTTLSARRSRGGPQPQRTPEIEAETFFWAPDPSTLDDDACEALLTSFRDRSGLTDDALIAAASAGTAPDEPYVAQWLVLLGREDLLRG